MSQKTSRKSVANEEKEKTETPMKDMKKKMAANAEKEKAATEKPKIVSEKPEGQPEKVAEKQDKNVKQTEKTTDKPPEKSKEEKKAEKSDKVEKEKKNEKQAEKKTEQEKPKDDGKGDKNKKQKQNGHNGTETNGDAAAELNGNGTEAELNGRVSAESDEELDVHEDDELFPELTYDDSEDSFEPPTADGPSRSYTRRSQAKATRTPETPRPTSAKHDTADDSKESKILKMKDDTLATDRKLRSADSPKPESKKDKKDDAKDNKDEPKDKKDDAKDKADDAKDKKDDGKKEGPSEETKEDKADSVESEKEKTDVEVVVIDIDVEAPRKPDTNYSKSRVKVSPYRRSGRLADQTASSIMANYTGNNTTMEMDITETSSFITEDPSLDDSYLSGLRSIRGRRSYKPLKEMNLRNIAVNRSMRSNTSLIASEQPCRPTAPVVGRKRKQEADDIETASEAQELLCEKRMRLLDRIAQPFRRTVGSSGNPRRAAEIVGINTDLPMTAPVSAPETFDPEALKPTPSPSVFTPQVSNERDSKRCVVM